MIVQAVALAQGEYVQSSQAAEVLQALPCQTLTVHQVEMLQAI
jgi:hypothetical protein